jgi:hypothetical protein
MRQLAPLCAVAGVLTVGDASAAVKLSDIFDGNYFSAAASGRGVSVLVAPYGDGRNEFFGAVYTYDTDGEPTWLILQDTFLEHQTENTEVPIYRLDGGVFGEGWDPAAVNTNVVGTGTVRVNSCGSLFFDLDMNDDSGFPDATLGDLAPVDGVADTCVYTREFTSCPAFSQASTVVPRGCELSGVITQDVTLTNEITWILNGLVRVGDDNANSATITIEPGTTMIGAGQATDYLYISPGSKIIANGTSNAPIVLTSPQDGFIEGTTPNPGDLGGIVVSGNAPVNACPTAPFDCRSEFDQSQRYGGDDPTESSGSISFFQVRYAGIEFAPNAEVNSFTFQGVGSGTNVHHLQAFRGQDDGVEFFGGTVNVRKMVVTEGGDDAVDWDLGWAGNLQDGLVVHGEGFGEDFGVEGASNPDNFDALPRATPAVANYTFIGNGNGSVGLLHKDGSGGRFFNTVVTDFPEACIEWADAPATYDAAGTPQNPNTDVTAFNGVIIDCDTSFLDDDGAPFMISDFFNSDSFINNEEADPMLNGVQPMPGSPALSGGVNTAELTGNQFFHATTYRGGFNGRDDWTIGWTYQPLGGN